MATIKSFTDIEQSKKLAEILPIESADMYYEPSTGYCTEPSEVRFGDIKYAHPRSIRCWSFLALFNVLPKIGAEEPMVRKLYYANEPKERYICQYGIANITSEYDNPIDACYEMIIKLNELNLL